MLPLGDFQGENYIGLCRNDTELIHMPMTIGYYSHRCYESLPTR